MGCPKVGYVWFTEEGDLIARLPYDRDFIESLSLNGIPRVFDKEKRLWRFPAGYAADAYKLITDYYEVR